MGDMTSETGIAHEAIKLSINRIFLYTLFEDNGKSVMTNTKKTWGLKLSYENFDSKFVTFYKYKNKYPHAGLE